MTIRVENRGEIAVVTIDRPDARNAVNSEMAAALFEAFVAFDRDEKLKVAVLAGVPGAFCAGFDLKQAASGGVDEKWFAEHNLDPSFDGTDDRPRKGPMGPTRLMLSKPVIAAISGPAVAGGMELALWCDLRVMERSAYMGVYCRRWGVPLIDGGTVRLPRIVGHGRAMDLILTGRKAEAEECLQIGLASRLCEDGTSLDEALGLGEDLARFPRAACGPTACRPSNNGRLIRQPHSPTNGRASTPFAPRAPRALGASPPARDVPAISGRSDGRAHHHRLRCRRHAVAERAVLPHHAGAFSGAPCRPRRARPHFRAAAGGGETQSRQIRLRHQGFHPVDDRDRHRDHR